MACRNFLVTTAFLFVCLTIAPNVGLADSGCIDCHSNEEKLTQNLSKEKPQKSAMTSGAG